MVNSVNPKLPSILCFYELLVLFASLILETDNSHVDKHSYSQLLVTSLGKRRSSDGAMHKDSLVSPKGPFKKSCPDPCFNQNNS